MKPIYFIIPVIFQFTIGCKHDEDINIVDPLNVDQELFRSTLFIEVKDPDGMPLKGVSIRIGQLQQKTDEEGFLFLPDVLVGRSTYITAAHEHYFNASRKCYPMPGNTQYIRIIMLPDDDIGFFSSSNGTLLSLGEKASLTLPADGYTDANGKDYSGVVLVAAQVISSDDPDLSFKMPGDLVGINSMGRTGALASLGMIAVELRSPTGDILQLKEGMPAVLRLKVGTDQIASAPQTVPMWHFNEALGIWEEDGEAVLEGANYTTEIPHFSFWNCDAWFETIKWGATFTIDDQLPAPQTLVCITINNLNTTTCTYTNEKGMVCGMVAAHEVLHIDIMNECGESISVGDFGPYTDSVFINTIPIGHLWLPEQMMRIEGFVVDCDNEPAESVFARIAVGSYHYYQSVSSEDGFISMAVLNCDEEDIEVSLFSSDGLAFNLAGNFPYAPVVNIDTQSVCQELNEYVIIEYGVIPERITLIDPLYHYGGDGHCFGAHSNNAGFFHICMDHLHVGEYRLEEWGNIIIRPSDNVELGTVQLNVNITYSGGKGDLLQGRFSGLLDSNHELQYLIPVNGFFSVLRK